MDRINWFPGHMAKGLKSIQTTKNVDMLIEIVDSRAINTSSNQNLIAMNKPILKIALKSDLADIEENKRQDILIGNISMNNFRQQIISKIYYFMTSKIQKLKVKGVVKPIFHILVVGLPNVGKSSLINFLSKKASLIVANQPGVTKKKTLVKINENFYLYDTPGVLHKKIESEVDGYILSLIGCIKKTILPMDRVCEYAFNFLYKNYQNELINYFSINDGIDTFSKFLEFIAKKYKFLLQNEAIDTQRTLNFIFDEINSGKVCKINYERKPL